MGRFGLYARRCVSAGCQRPQKNVLNDGHLSNQGTSFLRCHLSGPFRSMIEPHHRNSHFVCNQEEKYVAVLLIPLDGSFTGRHKATPVSIQKIEDQSGPTDLMQRWEDGPGYIFLESPDDQEELASYLKDREAEGVKSVHFYFPNDLDASTQTTNHMVVDVAGFSSGVATFTSRCEQAQ